MSMVRIESSLPGIGMFTRSGSPSVSTRQTVGMPSDFASRSAFFSRLVSTTTSAPGSLVIVRTPPRLRWIFLRSRISCDSIFFE